jgi:glycine oxidase
VQVGVRDSAALAGTPDIVVVGAGVIGLSAAWRLARAGLRVSLADPDPGRGSSWVAAGMLAPVSEAHYGEEEMVKILVGAAALWPAFAGALEDEVGCDVGYRPCGTIVVAADASDRAALDDLIGLPERLGLEVRRMSARACRDAVPALAPGVRGGAEMPGDHQVDNRRLVEALLAAVARASVRLHREPARSIDLGADGSVSGVRLDGGDSIATPRVLLATGARAGSLEGVPEAVLPAVRPVKGHLLRLRGPVDPPLLSRTVRGLVHGRSCYLVPRRDGTLVVGATEEERGFDDRVQAGPVHDLLHDARTLVPGIDELELEESLAGLRPGSPDNRPYLGWTSVPGLAVAAGHYRNGVLLAPLTAEAVVQFVTSGSLPDGLGSLDAQRRAVS